MKHALIIGVSLVALNLFSSNLIAADPADQRPSFALSTSSQVQAFIQQLKDVPAAELPNKVAQIIANASPDQKKAVAEAVVKAALTLQPSQAGPIISAIARQSPDVIVVAVQAAVATAPGQANSVTRALASARQSYATTVMSKKSTATQRQQARVALTQLRNVVVPNVPLTLILTEEKKVQSSQTP